jgi:hypothetical protein
MEVPNQILELSFDEINALLGYIGHITEDNPEKWFSDTAEEENLYWKKDATLSVYKKLLQRSDHIYMEL